MSATPLTADWLQVFFGSLLGSIHFQQRFSEIVYFTFIYRINKQYTVTSSEHIKNVRDSELIFNINICYIFSNSSIHTERKSSLHK